MTARQLGSSILVAIAMIASGRASAFTPLAFIDEAGGQETVGYLYWDQIRNGVPIPFAISNAGTPDVNIPPADPALDEFEALELGFRAWEGINGVPVQFALSRTNTNTWGNDGENVIFFADLGDVGYGAVTLITYENTTGRILDADIHMNDHSIRWLTSANEANGEPLPCPCQGVDPNAIYYNDIQGLAAHEIGHALGLDHSAVGFRESAATPTMYPLGIWNVPGDGSRPPNSRYRTVEPDDETGLRTLYPPPGWPLGTGTLHGVVHDARDLPLFGAHVVAKNLATDVEVGAMTGTVSGPYQADRFVLAGLSPGQYEVRVQPIDGSGPGYVSRYNFGGIADALVPMKFPDRQELPVTYEHLVFTPGEATPVVLGASDDRELIFRPIATVRRTPRLLRPARAFDLPGVLNADVTGPLASASFVYTVDSGPEQRIALSAAGGAYSVSVPLLPAGSLFDFHVEAAPLAGGAYRTPESTMQVGLSGGPLVFVSKTGSGQISAVDSGTMLEVDVTERVFSYPLGQAFHYARNEVFVTNFGIDAISAVPLFTEQLPPTSPVPFDRDGDGILNALEPAFDTDPDDPDSDGDFVLDGIEVSELVWVHPAAATSFVEVIGGAVANDGQTALGRPFVNVAVFNVTGNHWESAAMAPTPSGRFRLRLPAGSVFRLVFFNANSGQWLGDSSSWSGVAGERIDGGVKQLSLPPPASETEDTGTDPLDAFDGESLFLPPSSPSIPLESGADANAAALGGYDQRFLFVSGSGTGKVYKIDLTTRSVIAEAQVGLLPKGIALTPDGLKVYVANAQSASVSVLDAVTLRTLTTISMPGNPEQVAVSRDGARAVVTCSGPSDVVILDTVRDVVLDQLSSGIDFLSFLSPVASDGRALAGSFRVDERRVVLVDLVARSLSVVSLAPPVGTTSGIALRPDGLRGFAIDYFDPSLVEFDLVTGASLRRTPLGYIDIRDIVIFPPDAAAGDTDHDGVANSGDNCALISNPGQADLNDDGVGDACDLNDGETAMFFTSRTDVVWQRESGAHGWNLYRGDMTVLRSNGVYTQAPGTNPLAFRACGLSQPDLTDAGSPPSGALAFYLVTATAGGVEGSLGTDGSGADRPNDNPCP